MTNKKCLLHIHKETLKALETLSNGKGATAFRLDAIAGLAGEDRPDVSEALIELKDWGFVSTENGLFSLKDQ